MDKIGIYCSSIFPKFWLDLYSSLSQNKTEIELMFVGDVPPNFELPHNMKYIYSRVKPAQCFYIGATRVDGNYLYFANDDISLSPGALDNCLDLLKQHDTGRTIVSPRYGNQNVHMNFYGDNLYPDVILPVCHLTSRELWDQLGIDRNFVALYWDCDQSMQVQSMGGKVIIAENAYLVDHSLNKSRLCEYNEGADRKYFYSLWTEPSEMLLYLHSGLYLDRMPAARRLCPPVLTRQKPLDPIIGTTDILTISQGEKGKWV